MINKDSKNRIHIYYIVVSIIIGIIIGFLIRSFKFWNGFKVDWFSAAGGWFSGMIAAAVLIYTLLHDSYGLKTEKKRMQIGKKILESNLRSLQTLQKPVQITQTKIAKIVKNQEAFSNNKKEFDSILLEIRHSSNAMREFSMIIVSDKNSQVIFECLKKIDTLMDEISNDFEMKVLDEKVISIINDINFEYTKINMVIVKEEANIFNSIELKDVF